MKVLIRKIEFSHIDCTSMDGKDYRYSNYMEVDYTAIIGSAVVQGEIKLDVYPVKTFIDIEKAIEQVLKEDSK